MNYRNFITFIFLILTPILCGTNGAAQSIQFPQFLRTETIQPTAINLDFLGVLIRVILKVKSAVGMSGENKRLLLSGVNQKLVQFLVDLIDIASCRTRFAPTDSGAVITANASEFGNLRRHFVPSEHAGTQSVFQNNRR
jgi:hypothetical protein